MNKAFKINLHTKTALALAISLSFIAPTQAADFTIENGQVETTPQTLDNANEVGVIEEGGELNTSGDGTLRTAITASAINISITNKGSISTEGVSAYGIISTGADATISNLGSLSTENTAAYGIQSTKAGATISNQGSISIKGGSAYGIQSIGANATISNLGSLSIGEGGSAIGIQSNGADATIINLGSLSTKGDSDTGIQSNGANATISNLGSLSTKGDSTSVISSSGENATISNQGSISTGGDSAIAISAVNINATISNLGSISTEGVGSYGIRSTNSNATISNQGSISTIGQGAYGIDSAGADATINNSGLISATGPNSFAILGGTNDITLNLLPGSQIIGGIDLGDGGDNDTANVYGGSVSANLTFENIENINFFGTGVRSGDNVITVDTTGESTRGVALAGMTSSVHGIISQRMNQTPQYQPIQLAALAVSPSMLYTERKPMAWAQFFGGKFNRDAEGDALGYDYDHAGVNVGYEWDVTETRFGLMGGFVDSDTAVQSSSFSSKANNFYVGAYGNRKFGGISMTGSLIAGYSDFDNERRVNNNLNGVETATSDFDAMFISPSVTIASAYTLTDHWEFRPSTNLSYSMAWLDGYSETGTSNSNLTVDDRKAKALSVRAQLAAAYLISARSELELRLGLNSRNTDDDDTNVSIGGSQFKFANAGDENVTGGFAGASFRIFNQNNLTLVADVEVGGNSDEDYVAGNLNLEYLF
jgi:hypothetical protein